MGLKSIDVSHFVTNDFALADGQGKNLLKAFFEMVSDAEVMDGDLRLSADGRTIEKVNYGSVRLFGNRSVKPSVADNTRIRDLLRAAVNGYLDNVAQHLGDVNGGMFGMTVEKLESLRQQCMDLIGERLLAGDDVMDQNQQLKTAAKSLSRRTVSQIIQLIDDQVSAAPEDFRMMQSKMIGRRTQTKTYDGTRWQLVGGEKGMRMSRKQFETMFAEALDVASKKNPAYRPAFEAQIAHYKKLFAENRTGGELEAYFTGSLDADTIAEKMFRRIEAGIAPEIAGDHRRKPLTGAVGREMHDKLTNLRVLREQVGEIRLAEKADVSAIRPQDRPVQAGAAEDPVRACVSELLLNTDLEELEWCGFEGGERLGRILYRNMDVLNDALANVRARAAAGKAKDALPARTGMLASLANVSPRLADEMEKLLVRLDTKVFKGQAATKASFFASSQAVFKTIADAKLEDTINSCLREALKEHDVSSRVLAALRTAGNGDELTFLAVRSGIEDADDVTLRRMFANGLAGDGFSYGGILKGLGPYALKLLQGLDASKINGNRNPIHAEVKAALNEIKGGLPPLDADVIMADLLDYVKSDENIESIKVDNLLSAASIGQTMKCTVRMRGEDGQPVEKQAIYKLQRPGVGDEFRREMEKVGALIDRIASGEEKRFVTADIARVRAAHQVNADEILPECDFTNESTNALMGLKAYGQPPKNGDLRKVTFSVSNGQTFEVMTKNLFGSERLVLRPEFDNEQGRAAAMAAIQGCVTREDFQKEEVKRYFMPVTSNSMLVEVAEGEDMSKVLSSLGREMDAAMAKPVGQAKEELLAVKDKACKAFEAMLQLSAEFVNAALVDPDHFVHCDLHLGNLMYDEAGGKITAIDYGRAGKMPDETAAALREILKIGRMGTARQEGEDQRKCGDRLVSFYRQMLVAGAEHDSEEVRRAIELISTPENRVKLGNALADAFWGKGSCTVGNVLDRFVDALSTVPGLKGLPIPKEVTSFRSAYNRLQSSVQQLQAQIATINQQLATSQSTAYTDDDLAGLEAAFGPGGKFELQNLGYPEVETEFDKSDEKNWKCKVTVRDGRLGGSKAEKVDKGVVTGFQGTGNGTVSSVVLKRMIGTAKESKDARQRFAALSTILQILSEEEDRLKAFDLQKCFKDVSAMADQLSITGAKAFEHDPYFIPVAGFRDTSIEFVLDDKKDESPSREALKLISEEKAKILAAMETLKPHCSNKSLYVKVNVQSEVLPLVTADQTALRFERPAVSGVDIVLGSTMRAVRAGMPLEVPYIPDLVVERYRQVHDNVSTWGEFLKPAEMSDLLQYSQAVGVQSTVANAFKDFSFYDLRKSLNTIDPDKPWSKDESARELTLAERETYDKFRQVAEEDLHLNLPPVQDHVTRADYRKLLVAMDKALNIQDPDDLLADYSVSVEDYREQANEDRKSNMFDIPEVKRLLKLRSEECPTPNILGCVWLDGEALEAYEELAKELAEKDKDWSPVDSPRALDYVMARDRLRLCELRPEKPEDADIDTAGIADAAKYILKLAERDDDWGELEDSDLSLPEYMNYMRRVDAKNLEIRQRNAGLNEEDYQENELRPLANPTYEDFLELLPLDFDPKTKMLTKEDRVEKFDTLLSKAVACQFPGATEIQARVQGQDVTLQDALDLQEVVRTAAQKWNLGADRQNALNSMARIVKQMPFTMPKATFDPGDLKSCANFVNRFLSFNKVMFGAQSRDKDVLYEEIGEFNGKQADANRKIALPSAEEWDKLSFFEVRAYLDEYLHRAYPGRDVAKALAVNNCDRASQPLNTQELEAYRELETLAVNNHLIPRRRPAYPDAIANEKPLTHGDLQQLYVKIEAWQRQIPSVDGGNGFGVIVGGVL